MLADGFVPGVHMGGFFNCLLAALIIAVLQDLLLERKEASHQSKWK
jgi:uncharacterized membrane protein YvlD (DUF360 family)